MDRVGEYVGGVLRVRVTAPPADGKANAALTKLLAEFLEVPRGEIKIVRGTTSRNKLVEVESLSEEGLLARLEGVKAKGGD
jgi:uncharacterized protein (TIGR00251 family)